MPEDLLQLEFVNTNLRLIRKCYVYKQTLPSANLPLHVCHSDHCSNRLGDVDQSHHRP